MAMKRLFLNSELVEVDPSNLSDIPIVDEEVLAQLGWLPIMKTLSATLAASGSDSVSFDPPGDRDFVLARIAQSSSGAYNLGLSSNKGEIPQIIDDATPHTTVFQDESVPIPFRRFIRGSEQWTFALVDTSSSSNTVKLVLHGWLAPTQG